MPKVMRTGRTLTLLVAATVALAVAFVVAPHTVTAGPTGGFGSERELGAAFRSAFLAYWSSGGGGYPSSLAGLVDYWFRYHLVKALTAVLLLVVLVALDVLLWKVFLRPGGRRAPAGAAGIVVTALAVLSLFLVMANLQGAAAPFASLLPLLVAGAPSAELAAAKGQIMHLLADAPATGGPVSTTLPTTLPTALQATINDFARYHLVMAVVAAVVAVGLTALTAVWWRQFARTSRYDGRHRRLLASFGALSAVLAVAVAVVATANTATAVDPNPALLAFFAGGW